MLLVVNKFKTQLLSILDITFDDFIANVCNLDIEITIFNLLESLDGLDWIFDFLLVVEKLFCDDLLLGNSFGYCCQNVDKLVRNTKTLRKFILTHNFGWQSVITRQIGQDHD